MIVLRLIAFGRSSRGTRFGIRDWRAGPSNANAAPDSAARRYTGQATDNPWNVSSARSAAVTAMAIWVTSMILRRSIASATTPSLTQIDQTVTYVPTGATWKYLDNGSDQGSGWRGNGFGDSSWKSGAAQLGYGDGDETTVVGFGDDPDNKFVTTYFRKTFTVVDATKVKSLALRLLRDDGAVVYLNGQEVFRDNMDPGPVAFDTYASEPIEDTSFHAASLSLAALQNGTNTIAVEIHQGTAYSSDISFDLELKATVTQIIVTPPPPGPGSLPAGWSSSDIGPVAIAGDASFADGTFSVTGSGTDIWGKSDGFRYVYQQLDGDGEIVARVASMQRTDLLAKAGIMLRETLAADSREASLVVTPAAGIRFLRRNATGGATTNALTTDNRGISVPYWLKLVRSGSTITAYRSADGTNWQFVGSDTIAMSKSIFVGLAVTSHQGALTNAATFDHVSVS